MGYWMMGQVRTMMISVMHKSKLKMEDKLLGGSSWCHVRCSWDPPWGIPGALLRLTVVGVELVALGVHFDNCGSICAPVPGHVDWDRKDWTSLWSFMDRRSALNSLVRVSSVLLYTSIDGLLLPPLLDEVQVRFLLSSGSWRAHLFLPAWCSLHHQYYFLFPCFISHSTFWIFHN